MNMNERRFEGIIREIDSYNDDVKRIDYQHDDDKKAIRTKYMVLIESFFTGCEK